MTLGPLRDECDPVRLPSRPPWLSRFLPKFPILRCVILGRNEERLAECLPEKLFARLILDDVFPASQGRRVVLLGIHARVNRDK